MNRFSGDGLLYKTMSMQQLFCSPAGSVGNRAYTELLGIGPELIQILMQF